MKNSNSLFLSVRYCIFIKSLFLKFSLSCFLYPPCCASMISGWLPRFESREGVGGKTVDGQVGPPFIVADSDWESSEIRSNDIQFPGNGDARRLLWRALDIQELSFAGVRGFVRYVISISWWNWKKTKNKIKIKMKMNWAKSWMMVWELWSEDE